MSELEDALHERQRLNKKRREEALRRKGVAQPSRRIESLCSEFVKLVKVPPLPIAIEEKRKKRGSGELIICKPTAAKGWVVTGDIGLVVTTTNELAFGLYHKSVNRNLARKETTTLHLLGAVNNSKFIFVQCWPFNWKVCRARFHDEHHNFPGRGPAMSFDGSVWTIKQALLEYLDDQDRMNVIPG